MERRTFLQTGVAASLAGVALPARLRARPRSRRTPEPIRLSSNENPLGISPAARQAIIDGLVDANRYPGATRRKVIDAIARMHDLPPEYVVPGAGSTEVLRVAVHALAGPRGRLVVAEPTFEDLPGYGRPVNLPVDKVPLRTDFSHDIPRMRQIADNLPGPVLVFLCNPNNPTGTLTYSAEIDEWIESLPDHVYLLVDEAYYHYVRSDQYWTALKWVKSRPNVLVVRTFSKVYGMAGIRLGYGIAHPETASRLIGSATRNNINHLAGVAALASLEDAGFVRQSLDINERGKEILYDCLDDLGIERLPSHTNFVMHRVNGDLETYNTRMREHGIRVGRPFPPMLDYSRVSIGLPSEMERFAETLRGFRKERMI